MAGKNFDIKSGGYGKSCSKKTTFKPIYTSRWWWIDVHNDDDDEFVDENEIIFLQIHQQHQQQQQHQLQQQQPDRVAHAPAVTFILSLNWKAVTN